MWYKFGKITYRIGIGILVVLLMMVSGCTININKPDSQPTISQPTISPPTPTPPKYDAILEIFNLKTGYGLYIELHVNNQEFTCDNGYKCRIHLNIGDEIYVILRGGNYDIIKDTKLCSDIYCRELLSSNQVYRGTINTKYQSIYTWGGLCGNIPDCGVTNQYININKDGSPSIE